MDNARKMFILCHLVVVVLVHLVASDERNIEFLHHPSNDSGSRQLLLNPKSHIEKFADSWRYYARANDIAKREMLKMALRDALHSIERPVKHSTISQQVDEHDTSRVRKASHLLQQFNSMYSLSDAVKRTLGAYEKAKRILSAVQDNVEPEVNNKRDVIPAYGHGEQKLGQRVILKRTSKVSVSANPLVNGDMGIEYTSVDPRYSSITQAERAMRAAKIIMTYSGKKTVEGSDGDEVTESTASRKSALPVPRRHWDEQALSKVVRDRNDDTDAGGDPNSSLMESLTNGDDDLPADDKAAIESLGGPKPESSKPVATVSKKSKKEVVNQYVGSG